MAKKQVIFRLDEDVYKALQIYAIQNNTSVQRVLEEYVLNLLRKDDSAHS